ncbi:MAG TPA: SOS response-associated peptidase [Microbacteriaceae bacterium]|nr:SOS response-associated peptidase [Microbacteriaceae bacterium]
MCGRFAQVLSADDLQQVYDIDHASPIPAPSWNIAPTQQVAVVLESAKTGEVVRRLESARWSLVPRFATELGGPLTTFNARSETAAEKPLYRESVRTMRALIPAGGYFEWRGEKGAKTPYFIHREEPLLSFAALYAWWRDPSKAESDASRWVLSASILTAPATGPIAEIHERVPVFVAPEWWDTWLDPTEEGDDDLVRATVAASRDVQSELSWHAVAPLRGDGPELIVPVG